MTELLAAVPLVVKLAFILSVFFAAAAVGVREWAARRGQWSALGRTLAVVMVVTAAASVLGVSADGQVFAEAGLGLRLSAPVLVAAFLLILPTARRAGDARLPRSAVLLAVSLAAVTALSAANSVASGSIVWSRVPVDLGAVVLFALALVLGAAVGARTSAESTIGSLLAFMLPLAILQGVFRVPLIPLFALTVPMVFLLLRTAGKQRSLVWGLTAVALVLMELVYYRTGSDTFLYQVAAVGGMASYWLLGALPRPLGGYARIGVLALAVLVVLTSPLPQLLSGAYAGRDVSLAQRSFEVSRVLLEAGDDGPTVVVFGQGPGSSVDLSGSPDAQTIAASGRTLQSVPAVHIVLAQIFFKFGILGVLWLLLLQVVTARLLVRAYRRRDTAAVAISAFVVAGLVDSFAAGNHLFSNPLPPLLLGLLLTLDARARKAGGEPNYREKQNATARTAAANSR